MSRRRQKRTEYLQIKYNSWQLSDDRSSDLVWSASEARVQSRNHANMIEKRTRPAPSGTSRTAVADDVHEGS